MTITARLADGRIAVRSPYECRDIARNIAGGRWKSEAKAWTYPPTPTAALAVYRAYTSKDYTLHASTEVLTLIVAALDAEAARAAKTAEDLPDLDVRHCECDEPERVEDVPFCLRCKLIFESWLHQRRAFHFAKAQHGAALIVGMGGGKSLAATALFEEWDAKRVLIVCPRNVVGVWPKELRKHGHEWEVWHGQVLGRSGRPKKNPSIAERGKAARAFLHGLGPDQRGAVVVNYEAYWRGALAAMIEDFEWDAIALDESHRIKAPGGKASQFAGRLSDAAPRKLILS